MAVETKELKQAEEIQNPPSADESETAGNDAPEKGKDATTAIQSRNVSGRSWKNQSQVRASSLKITKKNNQVKSWQRKLELKRAKQEQKELQKEMEDDKRRQAIEKKERRLENEKRRAENEYKNAQKFTQTLNHNTAHLKLKTMSKKQLRQIKKTRLNTKTGVVEYVSPYAK